MPLAYSLGRALRALAGRSRTRSTVPSAGALPRPSWRNARDESGGLHIAVTALESHVGAMQQIADAWLMWANLWTHDPAHFRANVAYAQSIALRLEHDAESLVSDVRRLERLRDGVGGFDHRRKQAEQLTDAAGLLSAALHARLHELASAQGVDAATLVANVYNKTILPDAAWVQQRAATVANALGLSLREVVA